MDMNQIHFPEVILMRRWIPLHQPTEDELTWRSFGIPPLDIPAKRLLSAQHKVVNVTDTAVEMVSIVLLYPQEFIDEQEQEMAKQRADMFENLGEIE